MKENEDLIVSAALSCGIITEADLEDCRRTLLSLREFGIEKSLMDALIEHRLLTEGQLNELSGGRYLSRVSRSPAPTAADATRIDRPISRPAAARAGPAPSVARPSRNDVSFASRSFADPSPGGARRPDVEGSPFASWPDHGARPTPGAPTPAPAPDQTLDFTEAEIAALLEDDFPDDGVELSAGKAPFFEDSSAPVPAPVPPPGPAADLTAPGPPPVRPAALPGRVSSAPTPPKPSSQISPSHAAAATFSDDSPRAGDDLVGKTVGGCRLEAEIGRGAMGTVYRATHLALQKTVALKVLNPARFYDERQVEQFFAEARSAAAIDHHNIVGVHDVGQENGLCYIVMQYIEGGSVADRLKKRKRLEIEDAIRIGIQAARGLGVAHLKGIVHRDIKPANLMLTESGEVKIADFGLAYRAEEEANMAGGPEVMGTPSYMSPEQIDGRQVDQRADLYSLGVTLYLLTTGRKPFEGSTPMEVLLKHVSEKLKPPIQYNPEIPQALGQVIERLMAKQPDNRYACASDLIQDLEEILQGGKPKVVVAMEDVIQRMEELARSETAPMRDRRPVFAAAISGIAAAVCAILFTIALPEIRGASAFAGLNRGDLLIEQGEKAVQDAAAFARANPGEILEISAMFKDIQENFPSPIPGKAAVQLRAAETQYEKRSRASTGETLKICARLRGAGDTVGALLALDGIAAKWLLGTVGKEVESLREKLVRELADRTGMALVRGGSFKAGPDRHEEYADTILVDLLEVSNADYAEYVAATGHPAPAHWSDGKPPAGDENLPVVGIRFAEAKAFADWKGKRLPTAIEWEKAARGTEGFEYPWGDKFRPNAVNCRESQQGQLRPTRSSAGGASPYGCLNMAGNASEWTDSIDPETGFPIVRGGAWLSHQSNVRTYIGIPVDPDHRDPKLPVGFRLVKDVK